VGAELVAEVTRSARLRPLVHPADAAPEPGYTPSRALADFVRCRDLTCRAPGCDRPGTDCDIDHSVAFADGGATHASNLKCLCRQQHEQTALGFTDQAVAPPGGVSVRVIGFEQRSQMSTNHYRRAVS
jgi:hypothetical protein